jgi:hypothetical protein
MMAGYTQPYLDQLKSRIMEHHDFLLARCGLPFLNAKVVGKALGMSTDGALHALRQLRAEGRTPSYDHSLQSRQNAHAGSRGKPRPSVKVPDPPLRRGEKQRIEARISRLQMERFQFGSLDQPSHYRQAMLEQERRQYLWWQARQAREAWRRQNRRDTA